MFRRKREDGEDSAIPPMMDEPAPQAERAAPTTHSLFPRPGAAPLSASSLSGGAFAKGSPVPPPPPSVTPRAPQGSAMTRDRALGSSDSEPRKLVVGQGIVLSGQITACERLVVEGTVECSLSECRTIEIAGSGFFKGQAEVDYVDLAGRFEGTLTVRERLFIRSTGKIHGKINYSQIEIEPGGEISGDVKVVPGPSRLAGNGPMEDADEAGRAYANGEAN